MCGLFVLECQTQAPLNSAPHFPSENEFLKALNLIAHRGPDDHKIELLNQRIYFGFHRLSIMDLSSAGNQPFYGITHPARGPNALMCNGEIYNYKSLKLNMPEIHFKSNSDCEVLLPLYEKWGIKKLCENLDGEYAFVLYDSQSDLLLAARDPMGIRPLFYGKTQNDTYAFASEVKSLASFCREILPFPPGHFFDGKNILAFCDLTAVPKAYVTDRNLIALKIRELLIEATNKRLQSDAEIGFLLSGGLDSSLVCAIASDYFKKHGKKMQTFSIGMERDAIDSKYAEIVAQFIGAHHTSVVMSEEQVLDALRKVIYALETWDITTIRASVGMYLVCEYIKKNTKIKVLLTGEVSDELFGYKYTDFAPSAEEFLKESQKRIREIYLYDVLRADRSISAHSLEARVPFSDKEFVQFVMSIDPELKLNRYQMGKFLLRDAFDPKRGKAYLPDEILWRDKAAFSDAVGHSMVDILKAFAENSFTDAEFLEQSKKYAHGTPFTKESLLYRNIFEEYFPQKAALIPSFWMPNKEWNNCDVADPSARVLPNYGKSGV